jgi:hypothetical protein
VDEEGEPDTIHIYTDGSGIGGNIGLPQSAPPLWKHEVHIWVIKRLPPPTPVNFKASVWLSRSCTKTDPEATIGASS